MSRGGVVVWLVAERGVLGSFDPLMSMLVERNLMPLFVLTGLSQCGKALPDRPLPGQGASGMLIQ